MQGAIKFLLLLQLGYQPARKEAMFQDDIAHLENILDGSSRPTQLPLPFLNYLTEKFFDEREIARGGFGVVYKGELKNRFIAVKKLTFSDNAEKEFDREIGNLLRVDHKNIVRFLGYCNNRNGTYVNVAKPGEPENISCVYTEERILCFEYISNGSLTGHIHDELRGHEWHIRYKIIKEICQALYYLHNKKNLIHRDLKPANILINDLMEPKIADLGISKLLTDGLSKAMTTNVSASWEYAAPEYINGRVISVKYDIYSLGKIIIELVTGYRQDPDLKTVLTRWRYRWNKSNDALRYQQVAKCIEIGLSCQNQKPKKRPFITEIIKDLEDMDGGNGASGQAIPCWNELLWVEPPELFFPFQINQQISCSLKLHNETDAYMAFFIKTDNYEQYNMEPNKGIIQPQSHLIINITMLAQKDAPEEMWKADEFTIKSKKVNKSLAAEEINKEFFSKKSGAIVDKVRIGVVFDEESRAPCTNEVKKVMDFPSKPDKQQYSSSDDSSLQSGNKNVEVSDEEPIIAPKSSDDSTLLSGKVNVEVSVEEPTIVPPNSDTTGTRSAPRSEAGRVHLAIKSNNKAPLLRYKKRVMLELTGGDYTSDRPGLDLVVVLHVGITLGWKMKETKAAMRFVVRKLSPIDRLSLVTFSFAAMKLCPLRQITESSQQELLELIDGINSVPAHATNIKDGLLTGLKVLANRKVSEGRAAAIILMCDEPQSRGKAAEVSVGDVPVHTFGFGSSSNHTVLSAVAANSMGGTFSLVDEKGNYVDGELTKAFSQCLAGLLTVSVLDLEVTVAAVGDESRVVEMSAGSYPQTQHKDGGVGSSVTVVRFGCLYSWEVRRVIVDLLLPAIDSERTADILKVTCSYSRRYSGSWQQLVTAPETLTVWRTNVDLEEQKPVELQREEARLQMVKMVMEARSLFSNYRGEQAFGKLEEALSMLVQLQHSHPLLRTELQVLLEPSQYGRSIWVGRPYALSLLSSHDRQRFAARGNMDEMRLFATPRMGMYLEQAKKFLSDMAISVLPSSLDDDLADEEEVFGGDLSTAILEEEMRRLSLNIED